MAEIQSVGRSPIALPSAPPTNPPSGSVPQNFELEGRRVEDQDRRQRKRKEGDLRAELTYGLGSEKLHEVAVPPERSAHATSERPSTGATLVP